MLKCLQAYCMNSSLTGLRYIANSNLHISERIFWLLCVLGTTVGSYLLIRDFQANFEQSAVSVVYEQLSNAAPVNFAAIGVCEMDDSKFDVIQAYLDGLNSTRLNDESITQLLMALAFPTQYSINVIERATHVLTAELKKEKEKAEVKQGRSEKSSSLQHLLDDYRQLSAQFQSNCSEIFEACFYLNARIDCCGHFRPLVTTNGLCFLANSLQTASAERRSNEELAHSLPPPNSEHTLHEFVLQIFLRRPAEILVLPADELPFNSFETLRLEMLEPNAHKLMKFSMERLTNDAAVRQISPTARKCRFNDETLANTRYAAYSFTACLSDCVRDWQLQLCNCTPYNYMPSAVSGIRECNLMGYACVEANSLMRPHPNDLQPWRLAEAHCSCLPSCTDSILKHISSEQLSNIKSNTVGRVVTLSMQRPLFRYRRQALRTQLDVVVTIGGILGLFMGASILSGIELCYYLTIRLCNNNNNNNNNSGNNN